MISKVLCIKINRKFYSIKVVEEEASNYFFSMNTDKIPTFLSSNDNESSWSLENIENWGLDDEAKGSLQWEDWKVEENDVARLQGTKEEDKN